MTASLKSIHIIEIPERFYFKVKAAARYLGISPNALRKYTDLGWIKARRLPTGDRLYSKRDLDDFFASLEDAVAQTGAVGRHKTSLEWVPSDLSATPGKEGKTDGD